MESSIMEKQLATLLLIFSIAGVGQSPIVHGDDLGVHRLQIGESLSFRVEARKPNNAAPILLEAGAHYEFFVAPNDTWLDAKICCTASGWTAADARLLARRLIRSVESKRRCSCANWFELIGAVGCDERELFRIGCRAKGWTYTPRRTGRLYAFANDLASRYYNNSGSITVTVRRVAAPAQRQLPNC